MSRSFRLSQLFAPTAILLVALSLTACGSIHTIRVDQGIIIDKESISYLQEGLTQDQVRRLLGPAANISSFQPHRWEYVLQSTSKSFTENRVTKLILNFDDQGYLLNWKTPDVPTSN